MWNKSAPKKLTLRKEALRTLSGGELRRIKGGDEGAEDTALCGGGASSLYVNGHFYPCNIANQ